MRNNYRDLWLRLYSGDGGGDSEMLRFLLFSFFRLRSLERDLDLDGELELRRCFLLLFDLCLWGLGESLRLSSFPLKLYCCCCKRLNWIEFMLSTNLGEDSGTCFFMAGVDGLILAWTGVLLAEFRIPAANLAFSLLSWYLFCKSSTTFSKCSAEGCKYEYVNYLHIFYLISMFYLRPCVQSPNRVAYVKQVVFLSSKNGIPRGFPWHWHF